MIELARATMPALDLHQVMAKLMHPTVGEGWDRQRAAAAERDYRRFLFLVKCYPGQTIAPRPDADVVWHYHILDTRKYAADCAALFGYFLHHVPDLNKERPGIDLREQTATLTRELYQRVFGASEVEGVAAADGSASDLAALHGAAPAAACSAESFCGSSAQGIDELDSFADMAERAC